MFINIFKDIVSNTNIIPVIWETEISIAAVLTESISSKRNINISELKAESAFLLENKGIPAKYLSDALRFHQKIFHDDVLIIISILERISEHNVNNNIIVQLTPDKDSILEATRCNADFVDYIRSYKE